MSTLSPTLRMRLKAHEERKKNIEIQNKTLSEQQNSAADYKKLAEFAVKQEYGKDGLNLCAISSIENHNETLLVNLIQYNNTKTLINIDFQSLHAICILESYNVNDSGEEISNLFSRQNYTKVEYCQMLGQNSNCSPEQIYDAN